MEKRAVWRGRQPLLQLGLPLHIRIHCLVAEIGWTKNYLPSRDFHNCTMLIADTSYVYHDYGRISLDKLPCTLVVYFVDSSRGARTYIVRLSWPTAESSNSELWTQPADNVSQPRWNHEEISVPFTLFALAWPGPGERACLPPLVCRVGLG